MFFEYSSRQIYQYNEDDVLLITRVESKSLKPSLRRRADLLRPSVFGKKYQISPNICNMRKNH